MSVEWDGDEVNDSCCIMSIEYIHVDKAFDSAFNKVCSKEILANSSTMAAVLVLGMVAVATLALSPKV